MSRVDRRSFLKGVAAAAAATAAAPDALLAAAAPSPPTGGANGAVWKKTPCRLCGVGCGLLVAIQRGRAVAVKGDPESPVSRGLACVKGYHSIQALYGRDRITRALVRREDGRQAAVPMHDALDLVARTLRETVAAHGADSVALYGSGQWTAADAYVASRLFREALGTSNLETSARLDAAGARAGLLSSFGLDGAVGCYEDIDHADVFVLWDHNMSETDPVLFSRILQRRRTNPAVRIVDLATRTTRTSYAADRSLLYVPETEPAVANAICQEIVERKWADRAFVERHVAFKRGKTAVGYAIADGTVLDDQALDATWSDYVRFLADYTPERAAQIADLRAEDVRWLASLYGDRSRKVMSLWGPSLNQHSRGTWVNNLLYDIHLLVGKLGAPGNGALCLTSQSGAPDAALDAGTPAAAGPRPGPTALSMFRALERGDIRFLWVQATNPMVSLPNLDRYRGAARKDGRFVVVSEAYPTPTTDVADVVLPAAMWLEREGIVGSAERRAQHFERMLEPPGDAMDDSWQMIEVARRLGFGGLFPWDRERHVAAAWEEYARRRDDPRRRLPPMAELRARPGALWPFADGRETKWRYNTAHDPAADRSRGRHDFYGHPDHRAWIWLRPYEPPAEAPDEAFPFWLEAGRVLEHHGTGALTRRIPTLHRAVPRAYVEINRADAQALGIRNGEAVRLVSRRGTLELEARIDYRSQPARGRLFVPAFDAAHLVNRLTIDAGCPLSGQPGRCAVRVERAAPGAKP
jgi:nitrate reductase (cytochrome)